jgi:hypothetical protein
MSRRPGDKRQWMQVMAESVGLAARSARGNETMPDPVRRPPGNPPQEPIIIKVPPRLPEVPEIDRSDDEDEEEAEIRRPPEIVPELPPPPRPEERAVQPVQRMRSTAIIRWRASGSLGPRSRIVLQRTLSPAPNSRVASVKSG